MALLFWDASALAKRYLTEVGTSTVNALIAPDRRLLRAADAKGFPTVDPEALPAMDVPMLLARL
jgi:hypothetical protein